MTSWTPYMYLLPSCGDPDTLYIFINITTQKEFMKSTNYTDECSSICTLIPI